MVEGQLHRDLRLGADLLAILVADHKLHELYIVCRDSVLFDALIVAPELVQNAALTDRGTLHGEGGSFRNLCILSKGQGCFHCAVRGLAGEALEVVHLLVCRGYCKAESIAGELSRKGCIGVAVPR